MNRLNGDKQLTVDFSTLEDLLKNPPVVIPFALLSGYPACCLMFSRSWDSFSRYKQGIFSAGMGAGYTVLVWVLITYAGTSNPEFSNLVIGNEVILTSAILCLIAMAEVVLMAILRFVRIFRLRRKRKKSS